MAKKRKYKRRKPKKQVSAWGLIKAFFKSIWYALKYVYISLRFIGKYFLIGTKYLIAKIPRKNRSKDPKTSKVGRKKKIAKESEFQVLESIEGNIIKFEKKLEKNKSTIGIILGARGQGKSALGMRLLENIYSATERQCVAMGFEEEKLPNWIKVVEDIDEIPNGSFVLIDEGGILFSARESMSNANKMLSSLLLIARHKDISIVFISQNSSNLELNIIRQADYMMLKPSSLMQIDFERQKIQQIYKEVKEKFENYHGILGITYIYSETFRGFISNDLPSFWNEDVSKAFKEK